MPRATPRLRARRVLCLALLALMPACSGYARHQATPPSSEGPQNYGSGSKLPPTTGAKRTKTGTIDVIVTDDQNHVLPGAVVRYKGPKKGQGTTDSHGRVSFVVPPGKYGVEVAPCGVTIIPDSPSAGDVVIGVGQTQTAPLADVEWHNRYTPEAAVELSRRPPWPRGTDVTLGVHVVDGCTFRSAAGAALLGYRWSASSNFHIVRSSFTADRSGFARIVVRCTAAGDGSIVIANRFEADDRVDLLSAASGPGEGKHWCK